MKKSPDPVRLCSAIYLLVLFLSGVNAVAQQADYSVYAVKFGERKNHIPITDIAVGAPEGDSVTVCFMYWVLKGNGKIILVDAGFTGDSEINPQYISFTSPDKELEKLSIRPKDITDIIITHPHWDHIGGIDLYPNAIVWMQQDDYEYFTGAAWQEGGNSGGFNKKDVLKIVTRNLAGNLRLVNGEGMQILPGITVYTGSKHTYEAQYVLVETGNDKIIIASDNSWFYYNLTSGLPIPVGLDQSAYAKNLVRMKEMVKNIDYIIPGHDPLVFSKFEKVTEGIVKIK